METNILEREYSVDEVARMLNIHPSAVRRRLSGQMEPRLEARKEGKAWRVPESRLRKYINATYERAG